MQSLAQALNHHELIVLRVIGEWWELDLTGADKAACVEALSERLSQLDMQQEIAFLPPEEANTMKSLMQANGRIPVAAFARDHGDVRLMGPGRLEREEPWFEPENPAEALWYRGFLYRGFDETAEGMIEFYFLPEEFMAQFPQPEAETEVVREKVVGAKNAFKPVANPPKPLPAHTDAVDDLTTILLLAHQAAFEPKNFQATRPYLQNDNKDRWSLLFNLALEMGILAVDENGARPLAAAVNWLKQSRETQCRALAEAWSSSNWNELCHVPGLRCEGEQWQNDPILARTALLDALPRSGEWFRLDDLVTAVKQADPDFQRPDGNYDTWYIRDLANDTYLNGFESWDQVEGRLLRFIIQGSMSWLGLAIMVTHENNHLFQLTDRTLEWLAGIPADNHEISAPVIVQADATIIVPHNASRFHRFQVGRISQPLPLEENKPYLYRLTPASLANAKKQGISAERIVQFLEEAGKSSLPLSTKRGINRWAEKGTEGRLETAVVLRVRDAAILETLRQNPKTRPLLGESLGDLAVIIPPQHRRPLQTAVAQLGLLLDVDIQ